MPDEAVRHEDALESQAIAAVKGGDRNAYDYLVTKYMKRVMSVAWGIVRNAADAEDLAQEAFVKAFQSMDRFRSGDPFGPWIFRIVTNLSLDVMKHRTKFRDEELSGDEPAARRDSASLPATTSEIGRRIDQAIESLPQMQRVVARLFLVEGFEHADIASMTALREGTVRSHLSLARKKLREQLADIYGGDDE
ncbi:MAG TPA: sigma-70 family RNA polymerase sigma factor [Thermoanaerobaculia bacterium]